VPALQRHVIGLRLHGDVLGRAETHEHVLNRPFQVVEQHVVGVLVNAVALNAVHADQRETDTLDEDRVNLRVDENVVDQQTAAIDSESRQDTLIRARGTGRSDELNKLLGRSKGESDETLTVRDRHGRDAQARILVEPEQERDHNRQSIVRALGGLETVEVFHSHTRRRLGGSLLTQVGLLGNFLTNHTLPANQLILRNVELTVEVVHIRGVLIQRVSVNVELNLLKKAFSGEIGIPEDVLVRSRHGRRVTKRLELAVESHVVEEISELRDRESHIRVKRSTRVGVDLAVLESHSREGFKVSVHKQDVSLLNIEKGRSSIRFTRLTAKLSRIIQTILQQFRGHKHTVLLARVGNQVENTTSSHICIGFIFTI